ncbi:MAG: amidase [Rhodospirillales bacterium]|nr:amidase [Rhodospirillales bacterium]
MTSVDLADLTATEAARAIHTGALKSAELVEACLQRIAEREDLVGAWTFLDPDHARSQAHAADAAAQAGRPKGPLHGTPVGIKDIIDTSDMPTERGTPLHAGRRPRTDATVVSLLRQAGAVIMGKTVTTEFAVYHPGKTTNPHNPEHTPGGSSSGSAAAVAAGMVPLTVGSQTNGSVIRPASFCGVYGFKPSHGAISRHGVLLLSRALDHIGVFARSVEDLALIGDVLMAYDDRDPDMRPTARPRLMDIAGESPPVTPRIGFVETPHWDRAEEETKQAFAELQEALGDDVESIDLGAPFDRVADWLRIVMEADLAKNLAEDHARGADCISEKLRSMIEAGRTHLALDYNRAIDWMPVANAALDKAFEWCDALVTPATTGPAPHGLATTGDPIFCTIWSYLGVPAVTVPIFAAENGLPFGAQLIGPRGDDARLLRTARWFAERVGR